MQPKRVSGSSCRATRCSAFTVRLCLDTAKQRRERHSRRSQMCTMVRRQRRRGRATLICAHASLCFSELAKRINHVVLVVAAAFVHRRSAHPCSECGFDLHFRTHNDWSSHWIFIVDLIKHFSPLIQMRLHNDDDDCDRGCTTDIVYDLNIWSTFCGWPQLPYSDICIFSPSTSHAKRHIPWVVTLLRRMNLAPWATWTNVKIELQAICVRCTCDACAMHVEYANYYITYLMYICEYVFGAQNVGFWFKFISGCGCEQTPRKRGATGVSSFTWGRFGDRKHMRTNVGWRDRGARVSMRGDGDVMLMVGLVGCAVDLSELKCAGLRCEWMCVPFGTWNVLKSTKTSVTTRHDFGYCCVRYTHKHTGNINSIRTHGSGTIPSMRPWKRQSIQIELPNTRSHTTSTIHTFTPTNKKTHLQRIVFSQHSRVNQING